MDFNVIMTVGQGLVSMMGEIRQALGMEHYESHLTLYRRFPMDELTEELDNRIIELVKSFGSMELRTEGYLSWNETNGCLFYPVVVPPGFMELRQKLGEILPPETPHVQIEYKPHVTVGYIDTLRPNQRDLVDRLYFPCTWTVDRFQLESEAKPGKWVLEATYTLGRT